MEARIFIRLYKPVWQGVAIRWLTASLLLLCLQATVANAQADRKFKGVKINVKDDPASAGTQRPQVMGFKNVNKIHNYTDADLLKKVQTYTRKENKRKLLPALEEYVGNFGIANFYRQTDMIWRLGQLYEALGQPEKAKVMYRLVLKHHRKNAASDTVVRHQFNLLDSNTRQRYVPLKFYYELVDFRKSIDTLQPPRSVLTPLSENINGRFEEYGPAINRKNDTLLFTSRRTKKKSTRFEVSQLNEDLFVSKGSDDFWEEATELTAINTEFNEGSPTISPNGRSIYFSRCLSPDGYGNCDIFVTHRQPDGTWSKPTNLGPGINGKAWDSQPSLSHTGDTLYFSSDRLGGFGNCDLYMSVKLPNGIWGQAQNMGPNVNTKGNEVSPCYHPRYRVLYFSSDNQIVNFGNYDIYKTYFRNGNWQEPLNIGPLVNGAGSEYYFTIDYESRNLYYARSEETDIKNLDLYSFPLPMEGQPLALTTLKGSLKDSAGTVLDGIVSVIDLDGGVEVAPRQLRTDGSFDFDLIKDRNYLLIIQGDNFFRIEQILNLTGDTTVNNVARRLTSQKISFASVDFERDRYDILDAMMPDLDKVLNYLIDHPTYRIKISGHTDLTGDTVANLILSEQRAQSIKNYLTKNNLITPDRIEAHGFGSQVPIIPDEQTEADRRTNRRVEFEIIYPAKQ